MSELNSSVVLQGDWNNKLTSIECGAIRGDVIATDDGGTQVITEAGNMEMLDLSGFPGAPDNCPLKTEAGTRTVEQFESCGGCCLSWLVDVNGVAHI
jgi:hypothetical protein